MITVTSDLYQDKININDQQIILNGPPQDLQGLIQFNNIHPESLKIRSLAIFNKDNKDKNNKRISDLGNDSIKLSCRLNPGEQKTVNISHQLPSTTPPGIYEKYAVINGQQRAIKIVVQPTIEIDITPSNFTFLNSTPGTQHTATATLTNLGNLPFQIPALKHASMLDMDLLCRALNFGFREKTNDGIQSTFDEVTKNIKSNFVDWVSIAVKEQDQILQPGESMLINILFTIPPNADSKRDYEGNFRLWDKVISIVIKSHTEKTKNNGK
ncbi:hypothetical protein [Flavobacterium sp.]|uniref:COG1470 family protein n=1 Tax=Flavobacterium sp. TaxID=239 RepID=UPI002B7ECBFB|nr:hypothetical protein [Flavobacterium sp.]HSD05952.1 hypothetical protein [Flavobacterium sp.]